VEPSSFDEVVDITLLSTVRAGGIRFTVDSKGQVEPLATALLTLKSVMIGRR